jgi:hypothetical protein
VAVVRVLRAGSVIGVMRTAGHGPGLRSRGISGSGSDGSNGRVRRPRRWAGVRCGEKEGFTRYGIWAGQFTGRDAEGGWGGGPLSILLGRVVVLWL